jgi:hypothetical protein
MATDSIMGLFQTPEQYQLAQQQAQMEQARAFAAQDPMQRAVASQYFAGGQLGRALGGEDPQLKLATARQSILKGVDQTSATSLRDAAQKLADMGDLQGAAALSQQSVAIQAKIDEKQASREQALTLGREKIQSAEQLAQDRNAIMLQIAQMNAALRGANSDVQRQLIEQRIQDLQAKADEKQQTLQTQAQGRIASFESALDTLDLLSKHPGKKDVVGAVTGGVMSIIPGTNAAGFASQLETFKAQTFIPQVAALKGMGALSDAEGKKLTAAVGALDTKMKPAEFDASVARIKADLEAAKQRAMQAPGSPKQPSNTSFNSVDAAMKAKLPKGTVITINGRRAVVE